jgi:uncharacterized protein
LSYAEHPFLFDCAGDALVGIIATPSGGTSRTGVLLVVGGPQYRVGSHRQFVLLSRALAAHGIPCMRFDYRGMGDAFGEARDFSDIGPDIRAATDAFCERAPNVRRVVLWGLCDAASAICFYAPNDKRIAGLILLNPWVRTETVQAQVIIEKYYVRRLLSAAFWKKLLAGGVAVKRGVLDLLTAVRRSRSSLAVTSEASAQDLPSRMAQAASDARLPLLLFLSGNDFVADEFDQVTKNHPLWSRLLDQASTKRLRTADHTFSSGEWRGAVAAETAAWVARLRENTHTETESVHAV